MEHDHNAFKGGALMVTAMGAYILNDAIVKLIGQTLPVGQLLMVRGILTVGIIGITILILGTWRQYSGLLTRAVMLRTLADLTATLLFISALVKLPLANAQAILQAVPFVVILMGLVVLKEKIGWRRMLAVSLGFLGVLLIVQPGGAGFNVYSLIALVAMVCVAIRDVLTRKIPANVPGSLIIFSNAAAVTIGGAAMIPWQGTVPIDAQNWFYLICSSVTIAIAYMLMVMTMRAADVSSSAPFRYSASIWSIILGYFLLDEIPDALALAGIVVIAASGIYALHREAQLLRLKRRQNRGEHA